MIAFSMDIDWAPELVIQDSLNLFEKYNVKCTLVNTHDSNVIHKSNRDLFEIGIHPNFNSLLDGNSNTNAENIIKELLNIYPEAKGIRSHSLTQSTRLLSLFKSIGMEYDCNQFFPYNWNIYPYKTFTGLTIIPFNWEDDIHFSYKKSFNVDFNEIFNPEKNYIFNFHPIHIYLNSDSELTYLNAKKYYHNPIELKKRKNTSSPGTKDFLISLLEFVRLHNLETKKMIEIKNLIK